MGCGGVDSVVTGDGRKRMERRGFVARRGGIGIG